jgi:ketosteroid isomerase-like protein
MTERPTQAIADELRDIFDAFERDGEGALARLEALYDREVVFRDPLQTLTGRDAFMAMNRRIMKRARRLSFEVKDAIGGEGSLFVVWTMTYEPHRGPRIVFEGSSHARVQGGVITEQRDYWDLLSSVAASLPLVRGIYAALAPHLG